MESRSMKTESSQRSEVLYRSTRGAAGLIPASRAILQGLAPDGGLYVPVKLPAFDFSLEELSRKGYREVAYEVMKLLLTDYTEEELKHCIDCAYDGKFDTEEIAPMVKAGDFYYLELFHGATIAFKDMALSILPHLMTCAAKKNGVTDEIVILTATSGDTGKAALAGFADVPGTRIVVFYPKGGVSAVQEKQMVTQRGINTKVIGVRGNFDDCQTGVKNIFGDPEMLKSIAKAGFRFSSANSINIGRLTPQVAYYVYAYTRLIAEGKIRDGEKINVTVPTGNFGNILAAYYAKEMGLPIDKLICASNDNKVLYDFFETGTYDRNRPFILTSSPSMDILISSNLERLIYHVTGDSTEQNAAFMQQLKQEGKYTLTEEMRRGLSDFAGGYSTEADTAATIRRVYEECGYVMDTHTAVAAGVAAEFCAAGEDVGCGTTVGRPMVVISTASPFKFSRSVVTAIDPSCEGQEDFALIDKLAELSGRPIPQAIEDIRSAPVLHNTVCDCAEMANEIKVFLGISK